MPSVLRPSAIVLAALTTIAAPAIALAGTASTNVAVSATITQNCSISAGTMPFGGYDPVVTNATAALNATGTVTVACTKGATGVTISLGPGNNSSGCPVSGDRCMAGPSSSLLAYQLYTTSALITVWNTTNTVSYSPTTKAPTVLNIYGQVPAGQDDPPGSYTDTVVATINF